MGLIFLGLAPIPTSAPPLDPTGTWPQAHTPHLFKILDPSLWTVLAL